jgi:hypothetical protein
MRVVGDDLGRQRPAEAGGLEQDGEGAGILRPRHDLAGVVDQEDVGAFLVPRRLDGDAGLLGGVLVDELDVVLDDHGGHAGGGSGLELQHGAVVVELLGCDAHLLAGDLADLAREQAVVHADGAGLGTAAAQVAAVGKLDEPGDGVEVDLDVAVDRRRLLLDVLEVDATQDLGAVDRPVEFVLSRLLVDVACIGTRLAVRAVLHGHLERLQEGPVVLFVHAAFETPEEALHELLFLLFGLRLLDVHGNGVVEHHVLLASLVGDLRVLRLFVEVVEWRRQRHLFGGNDLGQRLAGVLGDVLDALGLFHFSISSVATSSQLFLPSPLICGAAQVTFCSSSSLISASSLPPRRFGSSRQRIAW